jgi:hypothetical protein
MISAALPAVRSVHDEDQNIRSSSWKSICEIAGHNSTG